MGCCMSCKGERKGVGGNLPPFYNAPGKYRVVTVERSRNPVQVTDVDWICVRVNPKIAECRSSLVAPREGGGKWLIFEPTKTVYSTWTKIMMDTECGFLGYASSVETRKSKDGQKKADAAISDNYIICVHTYDMDDEEDKNRVRDRLRERGLGKEGELVYTRDDGDIDI